MLSIIIPTHNSQGTIAQTLEDYVCYFAAACSQDFEVVVVLNGCMNGTADIVAEYMARSPHIVLREFGEKLGKGGAILEGFKVARGEVLAFADADGATRPEEIRNLIGELSGYDGVIGSRWLPESRVVVKQPLARRVASRGFNKLVRLLFGLEFKDTQCGAKVFRKSAIDAVMPGLQITNFAFDVELLYSLRKGGYRVKEVPIAWEDRAGSTLSLRKAMPAMFLAVMRLRLLGSPLAWLVKGRVWWYVYRKLE